MEIHVPEERAEQVRSLARTVARTPFQKRAWSELAFFVVSSAMAWPAAAGLALVGAAGAALTVVAVGVPILAGDLRLARGVGRWQLAMADFFLGERIPAPEPFVPRPGFFGWLRAAFGDPAAWRAVAYVVAKVALSVFGAWFALGIWVQAIISVLSPLTGWSRAVQFGVIRRTFSIGYGGGPPDLPDRLGRFLIGVILLFVAPWAMRLVVGIDRRLMEVLLGPTASSSRVHRLEESRDRTVDVATETLRRIERNLHDGTQAQLVALAMRLGQAKEKLAGDEADLDAVRRLVDEAHRGAKEAITDLRDLARGIHPPALDTGLENALATLAARSPVPTAVSVSIQGRPTPAIEAITYFCAAELLANVAQHAEASRASLTCTQHGPWLRTVVRDNGRGGAEIGRAGASSSGLAGLADRVGAVDGHLSIASPHGGPTAITVDLPFRS